MKLALKKMLKPRLTIAGQQVQYDENGMVDHLIERHPELVSGSHFKFYQKAENY